jgi:glycosyltransferase involved in cell wall biosynthesis
MTAEPATHTSPGTPRISVILTTFNRANVLAAAIASVLNQDDPDFELLIVDDGSSDDTVDVVRPLARDPRVRYIWTPNRKQPAALNLGLRRARGSLVGFLDSDDEYRPNHLSLLSRELHSADLDFVLGRFELVVEKGAAEPVVMDFYNPGRTISAREIECLTGVLFGKRRVFMEVGGFRDMRSADTDLFNRLKRAGYAWKRAETPTYRYFFGRFPDSRALASVKLKSIRGSAD